MSRPVWDEPGADPLEDLKDWMRVFSQQRSWEEIQYVILPPVLYDRYEPKKAEWEQQLTRLTGRTVRLVRSEVLRG